mmetsp:Transcript_21637/g.55091  ORF Transcript_21637/g.55091 Transcript_21637/m.55091 type:complete len:228 (-) Transcript_21637:80-763(-)
MVNSTPRVRAANRQADGGGGACVQPAHHFHGIGAQAQNAALSRMEAWSHGRVVSMVAPVHNWKRSTAPCCMKGMSGHVRSPGPVRFSSWAVSGLQPPPPSCRAAANERLVACEESKKARAAAAAGRTLSLSWRAAAGRPLVGSVMAAVNLALSALEIGRHTARVAWYGIAGGGAGQQTPRQSAGTLIVVPVIATGPRCNCAEVASTHARTRTCMACMEALKHGGWEF